MKRNLLIIILFLIPIITSGCGTEADSVGGGGQCGGVNQTGLCVTIDSLAPEETLNVDVVRNPDCGSGTPETFTDHNASVTISATLLSGYTSSAAASFVTFTRYTIDFSLSPGYTYAITPPSITSKEYNESLKIPKNGSGSLVIRFIDLQSKNETATAYTNNGWTGLELPSYTATYTFYGKDDRNRSLEVRGFFTFTIGNYDKC